jgi:hypothetical protein
MMNLKLKNVLPVFPFFVHYVGTLVVIHGNVLHKSEANRSLKSRYIYTFHIIEGDAIYDEKNWYFPPQSCVEVGFNQQIKNLLEFYNHQCAILLLWFYNWLHDTFPIALHG